MSETSEQSCWGITLWAVAIFVGLIFVTTLFSVSEQTAQVTTDHDVSVASKVVSPL